MIRFPHALLVTAGLALSLTRADARPLRLQEIADMAIYIQCSEGCNGLLVNGDYTQHVALQECLVACGFAPRIWEKNGVSPIDWEDHKLALMEYQQQQSPAPLICYDDLDKTVVIPGALCADAVCEQMPECSTAECDAPQAAEPQCEDFIDGPVCWWPEALRPERCPDVVCAAKPIHTFAQCADADGDGLPTWLEDWLNTDPNVPELLCNADNPCDFDHRCEYSPATGRGQCVPRSCGNTCTAFHLDLVAQDDTEVIVHVYYDFTPVPARALDLFINYNHQVLTLVEARRLAPLVLNGKTLATTQLADKTLRLSVFDTEGSHPIPTGPIIELVFSRHGQDSMLIAFSKKDAQQLKSVAPLQGNASIQELLADDSLWGPGVLLPALDQVSTILKLWYGFDKVNAPLNYANVPSGDALCADLPDCANEEDPASKARLLTLLKDLQAGQVFGGEPIAGLSGTATYLNGAADHLRLPIWYRAPLAAGAQSFSESTWFYSEGNSSNELKTSVQVVFGHLAFSERTRFAVVLRPEGDHMQRLVLLDGDLLGKSPAPEEVVIASGIPERTWHHAGFALDAATGKIDLYFDGERVADHVFSQPPAAVACPQFFLGTNLVLHQEGDVLGGQAAELVYTAIQKNGRYQIARMDPSGLSMSVVLGDSEYAYRDPDYSPIVDRLVYTTNLSGAFEVWMADGNGQHRRQLTEGFGDVSQGTSARRPRFAPDASGIVFDSNAFDVPGHDNDYGFVRHLYYLPYDATTDSVVVSGGGGVVDVLSYPDLVASQTVDAARLTGGAMNRQHMDARWLSGVNPEDGTRGVLLFSSATQGFDGYRVQRVTIADVVQLSQIEEVSGLANPDQDVRLLAARSAITPAIPQPILTQRILYRRSSEAFGAVSQFPVDAQAAQVGGTNAWTVAVWHSPSGYAADCWDRNHDGLQSADEDRDQNGVWNTVDCYPATAKNLYVEYDPAVYFPVIEDADGAALEAGPVLTADINKSFALSLSYPAGRALVRIEVRSPLSVNPLGAGVLATLHFKKFPATYLNGTLGALAESPDGTEFRALERLSVDTLVVRELTTAPAPSCSDTDLNGAETDIDCGGSCSACAIGKDCAVADDCETGACQGGRCVAVTCTDGLMDDVETDVDCGGGCGACGNTLSCVVAKDCASGVCAKGAPTDPTGTCAAPTCDDGVKNGDEVDVDCAGSCPGLCPAGHACTDNSGCDSGLCLGVFCAPNHCTDGEKNPGNVESGVDCGGECAPCAQAQACISGLDCESGVCAAPADGEPPVCVSGTCADQIQNGAETDVDCGGSCAACGQNQQCTDDGDCAGGVCTTQRCEGGVFAKAGLLETVRDATFSPDNDRLLLDAISQSRPVLLRTANLASAAGAEKILLDPEHLSGLSWSRRDGFMACNWVGGYAHPQSKALILGLRGGLDDLKVFSGLRDPDAFRSEAERGHAFLAQAGLDQQVASKMPTCGNSHLDCPDYHLCVDSTCVMVPCNPDDPGSCAAHGGRCTLRPASVEQEYTDPQGGALFDWVCAADCNVDSQCYGQACLNGPCMYCDPVDLTCVECRKVVKTLGELSYETIEGCPDSNSFRCEAGACVTDCYEVLDDQSVYLCNPALEYCDQGTCMSHSWEWQDLSPASFLGGHATPLVVPPDPSVGWYGVTQAVDQRIPVSLTAYGVADFGASPEVAVEVKGGPFYGGDWSRLGNALVVARTASEAQAAPIVLVSPYPFDALRLRLVTSPYANLMAGGTGFGDADKDFCLADLAATADAAGEVADPAVCYRRAQGSRYWLGYRGSIPEHEAITACKDHGLAGCPQVSMAEHNYLWGGQPAAVILGVEVDGGSAMNALVSDTICPYGADDSNALVPIEGGAAKRVLYGDLSTEQSAQKNALCQSDPAACAASTGSGLVAFDVDTQGFVLLNCNVFDPAHGDARAAAVFANIPIVKPWPASAGSIVLDNGNQCIVEVNDQVTSACYAWDDNTASLDGASSIVSNGESLSFGALTVGLFRSFGYDEGFTAEALAEWPLSISLTGYQEASGLVVACGGKTLAIPAGATSFAGCPKVKEGRRVDLKVVSQPSTAHTQCAVLLDSAATMPKNGLYPQVFCGSLVSVGGTVTGMDGGNLKLLAVLTMPGASVVVKELLNVAGDGLFTVGTQLAAGGSYRVTVDSPPIGYACTVAQGSGDNVNADVTTIVVTCKQSQPHDLQVSVTGLSGSGLTLLEKVSGAVATVTKSGSVAFPKQLYEGEVYDIIIDNLPTGPKQHCAFEANAGLSGTMPDKPLTAATVICDTMASTAVTVNVTGLQGEGMKLTLNGGTPVPMTAPSSAAETVSMTFDDPIFDGDTYSVALYQLPGIAGLPIDCTVLNGQGTWHKGGPLETVSVNVVCTQASFVPGHKLKVTVTGLEGSGLQLSFLNGAGKESVSAPADDAADGSFVHTMKTELPPGTAYELFVHAQPSLPVQLCTIKNGKGTMPDGDLDNLEVDCAVASKILFDIDLRDYVTANSAPSKTAFNGADIQVRVLRVDKGSASNPNDPALVGLAPADAKITDGTATFYLRAPVKVTPGKDRPLAYLSTAVGTSKPDYRIYVFFNRDGNNVDGEPFYGAINDYGVARAWSAPTDGSVKKITIKASDVDFQPLWSGEVSVVEGDAHVVANDVRCEWRPAALLDSPTEPSTFLSPTVMWTRLHCQQQEGYGADTKCKGFSGKSHLTGNEYQGYRGLPNNTLVAPGGVSYRVFCWADTDGSGTFPTGAVADDQDKDEWCEASLVGWISGSSPWSLPATCDLKPVAFP